MTDDSLYSEFKLKVSADVPDNFDWRSQNAISPPKKMGSCQANSEFSAASTYEMALYLKKGGEMLDLSEQFLIECSGIAPVCNYNNFI